ncbi:MAG: response regulator [Verrucomicrobiota bacterium]
MGDSVLVVDDDLPVRTVICDLLKDMNFTPVPAANGVEGVVLFDSIGPQNFAAAVVDLIMPEMSGKELVGNLKRRKQDIVVVLCTGHPSLLLGKAKCTDFGFDALIAKPFMVENFKKTFLNAVMEK